MRTAQIAAMIANVNRMKNGPAITPESFIPPEPHIKRKQTMQEQLEAMKQIQASAKRSGLTKDK